MVCFVQDMYFIENKNMVGIIYYIIPTIFSLYYKERMETEIRRKPNYSFEISHILEQLWRAFLC